MHEYEARVVDIARDIVARYRHHLGPLGAQALVDAVDSLPAVLTVPDPVEAPTGILDPRDPMTIIPTQTIVTSPDAVDPRTDPRNNLRPRRGPDPRNDPRTDPRPDPRPRPLGTLGPESTMYPTGSLAPMANDPAGFSGGPVGRAAEAERLERERRERERAERDSRPEATDTRDE